jgi:hypothetical protein
LGDIRIRAESRNRIVELRVIEIKDQASLHSHGLYRLDL